VCSSSYWSTLILRKVLEVIAVVVIYGRQVFKSENLEESQISCAKVEALPHPSLIINKTTRFCKSQSSLRRCHSLPSKQAQRHRRRKTGSPASSAAHGPSIKETLPGTSPATVSVTFVAVVRCPLSKPRESSSLISTLVHDILVIGFCR
jgi:hypothetical protein